MFRTIVSRLRDQ